MNVILDEFEETEILGFEDGTVMFVTLPIESTLVPEL